MPSPPPIAITPSPPVPVPPSAISGTKNARIAAAKPSITIQMPSTYAMAGRSVTPGVPQQQQQFLRSPTTVPLGLASPLPPSVSGAGTPYVNPFSGMYPSSGFVFKQFEGLKDFTFASAKSGLNVGEKSAFYIYEKFSKWSRKWFTHCFLFLVILLYSVAGAAMFVALEGPKQQQGIIFVRDLKHNFSEALLHLARDKRLSSNPAEWQGAVDRELLPFIGDLTTAIKAGYFDSDQKVKPPTWSFWNAMFYCGTIYTTIGYGHIYPATNAGRALTIVYAIFGIPMFLILLADFGKLFTRAIKVLWRYVRRLYYTGSLRKVRKQAQVQEMLRGMNMAYEVATFRRPSMMPTESELAAAEAAAAAAGDDDGNSGMSQPMTPAPTDLEDVDDEFNLPISLAIFLLIAYILSGAAVYSLWEDWSFFEASYFVFISMSTIGFGDYVPKHPMFMMASIVYLVFGMALTSMCINVVQVKLSDSFRQASAKISASIGMVMAEQEAEEEARKSMGTGTPGVLEGVEVDWPQVHRPPAMATVVPGNSAAAGKTNDTSEDGGGGEPPALPPKPMAQVQTLAPEEVKKRRRFWK